MNSKEDIKRKEREVYEKEMKGERVEGKCLIVRGDICPKLRGADHALCISRHYYLVHNVRCLSNIQ